MSAFSAVALTRLMCEAHLMLAHAFAGSGLQSRVGQ